MGAHLKAGDAFPSLTLKSIKREEVAVPASGGR
jgi:hypothetical protein